MDWPRLNPESVGAMVNVQVPVCEAGVEVAGVAMISVFAAADPPARTAVELFAAWVPHAMVENDNETVVKIVKIAYFMLVKPPFVRCEPFLGRGDPVQFPRILLLDQCDKHFNFVFTQQQSDLGTKLGVCRVRGLDLDFGDRS